MSWAVGWDSTWNRDIGYGVPAECDWPTCRAQIDRGLAFVCGGQPYGGEDGCGLYFCHEHGGGDLECAHGDQIPAKPDVAEWVAWKLTDDSWEQWREANPDAVAELRAALAGDGEPV